MSTDALRTPRGTNLTESFANFAASVRYEQLSDEAADAAKKTVLDSLGVMLAASGTEPAVRAVVDFVRESGGKSESSVLGFGFKAPAMMAALANGAMAHSLNYDDYLPWGQHGTLSIMPAAFALVQRKAPVSGRDFIAAVAAGQDIFTRLRCNVRWDKDWNLSTVLGVFAATATSGRIIGLSSRQLVHAFSIASGEAAGVMNVVSGLGSHLGAIYGAFPAKGAVLAAILAEKGILGVEDVLEGRNGIFSTYFGGDYDRATMLADLGADFQGASTLYKPWPAIGTAHSHIHATIGVMTDHGLTAADIDEFRVYVGDSHEILCAPDEERRAPENLLDARFSLPFLVALAAVRRSVSATELTAEALRDPDVLSLARRVVAIRDPNLDWKFELPNGRIELVLRDGRRIVREGEDVPGSAANPLTWSDLSRKFEECASAAAIPVPPASVRKAQQLVENLEDLSDAASIIDVVSEGR